jgi:hypothetical protein
VLAGGDAPSSEPVIDANGNAVAYVSAAGNLVVGQSSTGFTNVLLYQVADDSSALVSGTPAGPGSGNSDSPAIDGNGSAVAYRSDASNLVPQQDGTAGNVFLDDMSTTTLVSAVSGSNHTGAGSSSAPAIDGDGSKIVYLSRGNGLVAGEAAAQRVNVYLYAAPLTESFLVTGQLGSATVPGNGDASNALISRDSFPLLSSDATNLVAGVGAHSNGYRNVLISTSLTLAGGLLASGTGPGALVGTFSTTTTSVGQLRLPTYRLTGAGPDDAAFQIPGGGSSLLTATTITKASYTIQVRTDIGLGPIVGLDTLVIPVDTHVTVITPPPPATPSPTGPQPSDGITARLVRTVVKVGKKKVTRQMLGVFDAVTGAELELLPAPFQGAGYKNLQVSVRGNQVVVTARKGKKKVSRTFTV